MATRLLIAFVMIQFIGWSQLFTTAGQSPTSLVQNVLLGGGVSVSNVTYNGSPSAIGSFSTGNSNLGLSSGIILTTGTVLNNGEGPHGPNNREDAGIDNGFPGSPFLSDKIPGKPQTFNAATLEFDLVPYSDSVVFRYVFASEEYPEFVNSQYNDAFGFFISGPGITGTKNIALTPGNQVVSINSVNSGSNQNLYISNIGGSSIQYDGFTTVLTAASKVECGKTYHLRIIIADVNDGIYDSGIFLAANSLASRKTIDVEAKISYNAFNDPFKMAEGCVNGTVSIKRNRNIQTPLTFTINTSGTAQAGVDYSPAVPTVMTFNPGETLKTFNINALTDALTEGAENILMTFQVNDPCGNPAPVQLELKIDDLQPVSVNINDTSIFCVGDEIVLVAEPAGGVGPYVFLWNDGSNLPNLTVSPTVTTNYSVTVTDNCLKESATDNSIVTVPVYDPIVVSHNGDVATLCPFIEDTLVASATGGTGTYNFQWIENNFQISTRDSVIIIPPSSQTYTVVATDQCQMTDTAYLQYIITSPPLVLNPSEAPIICPGDSVDVSVTARGGFGNYYYTWNHSGETTPQVRVATQNSAWFIVGVSDDCQSFTFYDSILVRVEKPTANFNISSKTIFENLPITFQNTSVNANSYSWLFGDGQSSTFIHPNNTYAAPGFYSVQLIAQDQRGCLDTIIKPIEILREHFLYVPNAFTPDADRFNKYFKASTVGILELNVLIYDRYGILIFESSNIDFAWDGTHIRSGKMKQDVYSYVITYSTPYEINLVKKGFVTLIR